MFSKVDFDTNVCLIPPYQNFKLLIELNIPTVTSLERECYYMFDLQPLEHFILYPLTCRIFGPPSQYNQHQIQQHAFSVRTQHLKLHALR